MTRFAILAAALSLPLPAAAQGVTQPRSGLGQTGPNASNSLPAGAINAETGPQSRPAYKSGASTTRNPGAAFVKTTPVPSTGPALAQPGTLTTTTTGPNGATSQRSGGPGVGQASRPPQ